MGLGGKQNHRQTMAMKGQVLTYLDVKKIVEKQLNHSISDDFIADLFKQKSFKTDLFFIF